MMKKSKQRHVIVTGGSRGIGFAVAAAFIKNGDKVLLIARDRKELSSAKNTLGKNAFVCGADVSKPSSRKKISACIRKYFKNDVRILVNAAGIYGPKGILEENDLTLWKQTIEVNLLGVVYMCALVLPLMKRKRIGRIINFSGGGEGPFPYFTAYSASKGAVVRFTESLAAEVLGFGISVNAIAPGAVNTALMKEVIKAGAKKVGMDFYKRSLEQKRSGGISPEKAANLILFLASKEAGFISGKVLSAVRDAWKNFPKHKKDIAGSDLLTFRRVKPKDRGFNW